MNIELPEAKPRVYIVVTAKGQIITTNEDQLFVEPDGSLSLLNFPYPVVLLSEHEVDNA